MKLWFFCALAAAVLTACDRTDRSRAGTRPLVRVAAAADLNVALADLIARFSISHPVDVTASYGSSGNFFSQLLNGAPFDLFLSADVEYPRGLVQRGLAVPDSAFTYAIGRLVVWSARSSTIDLDREGLRVVRNDAVRRVAVANPEHAPYGRAAIAALRSAGVYDEAKPKLVYGESVAQAMQFAQSGSADVGLVALSLALSPNVRSSGRWVEVPADAYPRLEQGGVILRAAKDVDAARAFRSFVIGPEGRSILGQHGFGLPEP